MGAAASPPSWVMTVPGTTTNGAPLPLSTFTGCGNNVLVVGTSGASRGFGLAHADAKRTRQVMRMSERRNNIPRYIE
jgi:hypothetical protein